MSSCFHLTDCMAKHQMEVSCGGNTIPTTSKYLGVTLDRSLTYTKHLSQLSMKVNARCNLPCLCPSRVLLTSVVSKCPHTSTRCSSEQRPSTGVRMHPIDTNLNAASCQRDNASRLPQKQKMRWLIPPC